jgi:hypothetical protein
MEEMLSAPRDSWNFVFWSTLVLELLGRAALSRISPALLADHDNWNHLYYALGHEPKAKKFTPKSIAAAQVFERVGDIYPEFTPELKGFCLGHANRRNSDLHSGEGVFDGLKSSAWLPNFYKSCEVLLNTGGVTLERFTGAAEAKVASQIMKAASDDSAKAVAGTISAHKTVWEGKDAKEKTKLGGQAALWARRGVGHVVQCPACKCSAILTGEPIASPIKTIKEDEITETQEQLPNKFECIGCGMKITGLSQLSAAGLGDAFKSTQVYDAAEYYATEDRTPDYDDDNNEPMG